MSSRPRSRGAAALLTVVALLSADASADTLTVKAGESIQAVIDGAGPGDKIVVQQGTYTANLVIPSGKDGLVLQGKGKVYIDAHDPDMTSDPDAGVLVHSEDVTLRNLIIRHGDVGVTSLAEAPHGPVVEKVTVLHTATGVAVVADGVSVDRCTFRYVDDGVNLSGDGARVIRSSVQLWAQEGLAVFGEDVVVQKNVLLGGHCGLGIRIEGPRPLVDANQVSYTQEQAYQVTGDDAVVTRNMGHATASGIGFQVQGENPTVARNSMLSTGNDHEGFLLTSTGNGGLFERNTCRLSAHTALDMRGDDLVVRKNRVMDSGSADGDGLSLRGDRILAEGNRIQDFTAVSVCVDGDDVVLRKNRIQGGARDGVFIVSSSNGTLLESNRITDHASEGVDNRGTDTVLRKNRIKNNRIDVVNDGDGGATISIEPDNKIGDGSDGTTQPEI